MFGVVCLNDMKAKTESFFIKIEVVRNHLYALVYTKASDLFIIDIATKKMCLKVVKDDAHLNTVNSIEVPTIGTTHKVYM